MHSPILVLLDRTDRLISINHGLHLHIEAENADLLVFRFVLSWVGEQVAQVAADGQLDHVLQDWDYLAVSVRVREQFR